MDGPPKDLEGLLLDYAGHIVGSVAIHKAQTDKLERQRTDLECYVEEFNEFKQETQKEIKNLMWRMILIIGAASILGSFLGGFASGN